MNQPTKQNGGKRPGSGRKKLETKKVLGIRHKKSIIDRLKQKFVPKVLQNMGRKWIDDLANEIESE